MDRRRAGSILCSLMVVCSIVTTAGTALAQGNCLTYGEAVALKTKHPGGPDVYLAEWQSTVSSADDGVYFSHVPHRQWQFEHQPQRPSGVATMYGGCVNHAEDIAVYNLAYRGYLVRDGDGVRLAGANELAGIDPYQWRVVSTSSYPLLEKFWLRNAENGRDLAASWERLGWAYRTGIRPPFFEFRRTREDDTREFQFSDLPSVGLRPGLAPSSAAVLLGYDKVRVRALDETVYERRVRGYEVLDFTVQTFRSGIDEYPFERQMLTGTLDRYQNYKATAWDLPENDWNLLIRPDADFHWMTYLNVPDNADLHHADDGAVLIEGELTPDHYLRPYFLSVFPWLPISNHLHYRNSPLVDRKLSLYGVYSLDCGHGCRPELHPFDAIWWEERSLGDEGMGKWYYGVFQDRSERFENRPSRLVVLDANWSTPPRAVTFDYPFFVTLPERPNEIVDVTIEAGLFPSNHYGPSVTGVDPRPDRWHHKVATVPVFGPDEVDAQNRYLIHGPDGRTIRLKVFENGDHAQNVSLRDLYRYEGTLFGRARIAVAVGQGGYYFGRVDFSRHEGPERLAILKLLICYQTEDADGEDELRVELYVDDTPYPVHFSGIVTEDRSEGRHLWQMNRHVLFTDQLRIKVVEEDAGSTHGSVLIDHTLGPALEPSGGRYFREHESGNSGPFAFDYLLEWSVQPAPGTEGESLDLPLVVGPSIVELQPEFVDRIVQGSRVWDHYRLYVSLQTPASLEQARPTNMTLAAPELRTRAAYPLRMVTPDAAVLRPREIRPVEPRQPAQEPLRLQAGAYERTSVQVTGVSGQPRTMTAWRIPVDVFVNPNQLPGSRYPTRLQYQVDYPEPVGTVEGQVVLREPKVPNVSLRVRDIEGPDVAEAQGGRRAVFHLDIEGTPTNLFAPVRSWEWRYAALRDTARLSRARPAGTEEGFRLAVQVGDPELLVRAQVEDADGVAAAGDLRLPGIGLGGDIVTLGDSAALASLSQLSTSLSVGTVDRPVAVVAAPRPTLRPAVREIRRVRPVMPQARTSLQTRNVVVLKAELGYFPYRDGRLHKEEESVLAQRLNAILHASNNSSAQAARRRVFGSDSPLRLDWEIQVTDLGGDRRQVVHAAGDLSTVLERVRQSGQPGLIMLRDSFDADMVAIVLPDDMPCLIDARLTASDPFDQSLATEARVYNYSIIGGAAAVQQATGLSAAALVSFIESSRAGLGVPAELAPAVNPWPEQPGYAALLAVTARALGSASNDTIHPDRYSSLLALAHRIEEESTPAQRAALFGSGALGQPSPIQPAENAVFEHFPRTTTLTWSEVPGAASYAVEVQYFAGGQWLPLTRESGIATTHFTFDFVGAQRGRWRVSAVDADGVQGLPTAWRHFRYTR